MAAGELTERHPDETHAAGVEHAHSDGQVVESPQELPPGSVVTISGRVSTASEFRAEELASTPFSSGQLARLDEALTLVSRHTKLRFSIYLGDLGADSLAGANRLVDQLGPAGRDAVLIAVDPGNRNVHIVTGPEARVRLSDRGCELAVINMIASFKESDLLGGLVSGLSQLSEQTG